MSVLPTSQSLLFAPIMQIGIGANSLDFVDIAQGALGHRVRANIAVDDLNQYFKWDRINGSAVGSITDVPGFKLCLNCSFDDGFSDLDSDAKGLSYTTGILANRNNRTGTINDLITAYILYTVYGSSGVDTSNKYYNITNLKNMLTDDIVSGIVGDSMAFQGNPGGYLDQMFQYLVSSDPIRFIRNNQIVTMNPSETTGLWNFVSGDIVQFVLKFQFNAPVTQVTLGLNDMDSVVGVANGQAPVPRTVIPSGQIFCITLQLYATQNRSPRRIAQLSSLAVPSAPENVSLAVSSQVGTLVGSWDPPANTGGTPITNYYVLMTDTTINAGKTFNYTSPHIYDGLDATHSYTLAVAAENSSGIGPYSVPTAAIAPLATSIPTEPLNVTIARAPIANSLIFNWNPPASNGNLDLVAYRVYFQNLTIITEEQYECPPTQTNFQLINLIPGMQYSVQISAVNTLGESARTIATDPIVPRTDNLPAPSDPINVSATAAGVGQVAVSAEPNPNNAAEEVDMYILSLYDTNNTYYFNIQVGAGSLVTGSPWVFSGLSSMNSYTVLVQAHNDAGVSPGVSTSSVTPLADFPSAPTNATLSPTAIGGELQIAWIPSASSDNEGVTGYMVELRNADNNQVVQTVTDLAASATVYTFTGLYDPSIMTYMCIVAAINSRGVGSYAYSGTATPTTLSLPSAPSSVMVVPTLNPGELYASWIPSDTSVNEGVTEYRLVLSNSTVEISTVASTGFSYLFTGLSSAEYYTIALSAKNGAGYGDAITSSPASPLPVPQPSTPTSITLSATSNPGELTVTWEPSSLSANEQITSYIVTLYDETAAVISDIAFTYPYTYTYTYTDLSSTKTYNATVAAVNSTGTSNTNGSLAVSPLAPPPPPPPYTLSVSSEGILTGFTGTVSGDLVIPASIGGVDITTIGSMAFVNNTGITSVTIPDSVTVIGTYAFNNCSNLSNVTLPSGLTTLSRNAFYNCRSLTNVTLPNTLFSIGIQAFEKCTSLTSITIPDSVTSISQNAFSACSNLGSVTLPNNLVTIPDNAFSSCTSLSNINIPDSVTTLGSNVFISCTSLSNITLPSGLTTIGLQAFQYTPITSITIPNSVTSIGSSAFSQCKSLTSVTLPNSLTTIEAMTFSGCLFSNITIPASVTTVGITAFNPCSNASITFLGKPTTFGMWALATTNTTPNTNTLTYPGPQDATFEQKCTTAMWKGLFATS